MKQNALMLTGILVMLAMGLTGCELVEGIFKAGFWTAIILVVIVVGIIIWLIGKARK
jgi:hypothetical protein